MERAYRNLGYVLTVLLPISIAGFWIPYLSEIPHFEPSITAAVHIHAVLLISFLILLIVQPLAIRYNAFSTHRILGRLSNIIVPFALVFLRRDVVEGISQALDGRHDGSLSSQRRVSISSPAASIRRVVRYVNRGDPPTRRRDAHAMHDLHRPSALTCGFG
jgi:hypothetical protein